MTQQQRAWLTRSGRAGERDSWAVDNGVTPGGYGEVSDLTSCSSLQDVRNVVAEAFRRLDGTGDPGIFIYTALEQALTEI